MAVQFHVAHSASVIGVGVLAAGPYHCAQGSSWVAVNNCMKPRIYAQLPTDAQLKAETDGFASMQLIDPVANLRRARVWLFSGKKDETVVTAVVDALERFYRGYDVPAASIEYVKRFNAGHAMVTEDFGGKCAVTDAPYFNDCDYDAAGALLKHIYGELKAPAREPEGKLIAFDQKEFSGKSAYAISLADVGYAYVPRNCASVRCRVHVAFHGCKQNAEAIGDKFTRHAGYNEWAERNDLIVLYPQTIARYGYGSWPVNFVYNPNACWDWWGYSALDYDTKDGPQIRAVQAMLTRLGQPR